MQDQNIATRLKFFIDSEGFSSSKFADVCGIPRPSLSQLLTGRNKKVSNTFLEQIHSTFPNLSMMWLVFGEGDMLEDLDPDNATEDEIPMVRSEEAPLYITKNTYKSAGYQGQKDLLPDNASDRIRHLERENVELQRQIDEIKNAKRKVTGITVYYDDNTFETFVPGGR